MVVVVARAAVVVAAAMVVAVGRVVARGAVAMAVAVAMEVVAAMEVAEAMEAVVEEVSFVRTHLSSSRPRCRPGIAPPVGSSLRSSPQKFEIS